MVKVTQAPDNQGGPAAPGGVESLASLASEATELDVAEHQARQDRQDRQERQEQQAAQAEATETARAVAAMLRKVRDVAAGVADSTGKLPAATTVAIWNDKAVGDIADALVELPDEATGWLMQLLERIAPYGALAFAVGAPSWATYLAVKAHQAKTVDEAKDVGQDGQQQPS